MSTPKSAPLPRPPLSWKRYLGHRVHLRLNNDSAITGHLTDAADGYLRLTDTSIKHCTESGGWFEQMEEAEGNPTGPLHAETMVQEHYVVSISCWDEIPDNLPPQSMQTQSSPRKETDEETDEETNEALDPEPLDTILVELGVKLLPLVKGDRQGKFIDGVKQVRLELYQNFGVHLSAIRIRDNLRLAPDSYRISINGYPVVTETLDCDRLLVTGDEDALKSIDGVETREPVFGTPAKWIDESERTRANADENGLAVFDASRVLQTHLVVLTRRFMPVLLNHERLVQLIRIEASWLLESPPEPFLKTFTDGSLIRILRALLGECVSIRNIARVVESVVLHIEYTNDLDEWLRRVRIDLGREVCGGLSADDGSLSVVYLEPSDEDQIVQALDEGTDIRELGCVASLPWRLPKSNEEYALVLRNSRIRPLVAQALIDLQHSIPVIAAEEIPREVGVKTLAMEKQDVPRTQVPGQG